MIRQSEDIAKIRELAKDWNSGWDCSDVEALFLLYTNDPY
jgi:ketosteroid isomerase-like protein